MSHGITVTNVIGGILPWASAEFIEQPVPALSCSLDFPKTLNEVLIAQILNNASVNNHSHILERMWCLEMPLVKGMALFCYAREKMLIENS
jgi:hypothetical protein